MKAEAKSLRFLGEGKKLSVPFFQRRYVWEESNWQELLDTFQSEEIMPFLGSIILKEESSKESNIIDGQQRLTTITILAKAIYDCLSDDSKKPGSGIRNYVENFLYYRNNAADDFSDSFVRIQHSRIDQNEYNQVIESRMLNDIPAIDLDTINSTSGNVLRCYKFYCEKLQHIGDAALKALFNSIFDECRKVFVLIELEQGDINEQTIFDTINRAGIRLSTADIIKNNLFKKLLEAAGTDAARKNNVIKLYENCWDNIFNANQQESELWDTERVFGNVKHNNLEFLLYCVACIKWGEDGDMFSKLENVFERETSSMGFTELQFLITEIKDYALIFKKYILEFKAELEDEEKNVYFKYEDGVRRLLLILQKFGVQMFYPYVVKRIKEVNQNDSDAALLSDLHVLESFIIRRKISPKGTHDYTSKCYSIIKYGINKLVETDTGSDDAGISDVDIKQYLCSTKDDAAKMILFWIELYRRRLPGFDIDALEYKYTLEHIMPKKWEANWSNIPIVENGGTFDCTSDEGKAIRNSLIQSIGNKTLLTSSLNSTVKNSDYSKKVNGINNNKPGYKSHTSLLLTKELVDNAATDPVWDEAHIIKRTNDLFTEFTEIWPSFKERVVVEAPEEESESNISQFTAEQLADPLKLLEAMDSNEEIDANDGMISVAEFIQMVNVQSETIEKYIRNGSIVPDSVIPQSGHRSVKLFKKGTVLNYANQFGWSVITDENRKDVFLSMIDQMDMSYSYKPVLIKALLYCIDDNGECGLPDLVTRFMDFYQKRITEGKIAEKDASCFSKPDCSYEDAEKVILIYPFKRFADIGALNYDKDSQIVSIDSSICDSLSNNEKQLIEKRCDEKIKEYFERLEA